MRECACAPPSSPLAFLRIGSLPRPWVWDCDLASVRLYLANTGTVPIPHEYFLHPIRRFMYTVTRATTKAQDYRHNRMRLDVPYATFQHVWATRFPVNDKRIGLSRPANYSNISLTPSRALEPTSRTDRREVWQYTLPAGRPALVAQCFSLEEYDRRRAFGNLKLWLPSTKARKVGAKAKGVFFACGPVQITYERVLRSKSSRLPTLKMTWWCGRLSFDGLQVRVPFFQLGQQLKLLG